MKLPEILFENDAFIVINKPAGLLSVPDRKQSAPSLKDLLIARYQQIFTVHRLDRETSGVIVFAKTADTHRYLSGIFERREVEKIYFGIVPGALPSASGLIEEPIAEHPARNGTMMIHRKGKPAVTGYQVLEDFSRYSLIKFDLFTGRTHQIRVHMKNIGHPIVCDDLYGDGKPILVSSLKKKYNLSKSEEEEKPILGRLGLHAARLSFTDESRDPFTFEAPLPKDMRALLNQLGKNR
ncbi:MAG: RNA pseudouridine synthase [Bacteroidota bacterium]|nr:RNA pseudouridine synthase [Bacteroidota bacterium]MDP4211193.1 RNA pseudouridine synthase [Bacteroidota bacterium]MDP4249409.1 RNA pseudouridine synthase [Bacteroidota bacterium]